MATEAYANPALSSYLESGVAALKISSANDLFSQPGYTKDIEPAKEPSLRIVASYSLSPMIPCGLKGCHQPHNDGFVVELSGARISNVGHVCGQQFGDRFDLARKDYTDRILRPEALQTLGEFRSRIDPMQMQLHSLRGETNRLCERIQAFKGRFPRLFKDLERRAHEGNDRVDESVARTSTEIEDLMAANPGGRRESFRFKEEFRGRLAGLRILATRLREEIVTNFVDKADVLIETELTDLSTEKLLSWGTWAEGFDQALAKAKSLLADGEAFFAQENFTLMAYLTPSKEDAAQLRRLAPEKLFTPSAADLAANPRVGLAPTKREKAADKKLQARLRLGRR